MKKVLILGRVLTVTLMGLIASGCANDSTVTNTQADEHLNPNSKKSSFLKHEFDSLFPQSKAVKDVGLQKDFKVPDGVMYRLYDLKDYKHPEAIERAHKTNRADSDCYLPCNKLAPGWDYTFDEQGRIKSFTTHGWSETDNFLYEKNSPYPYGIVTYKHGALDSAEVFLRDSWGNIVTYEKKTAEGEYQHSDFHYKVLGNGSVVVVEEKVYSGQVEWAKILGPQFNFMVRFTEQVPVKEALNLPVDKIKRISRTWFYEANKQGHAKVEIEGFNYIYPVSIVAGNEDGKLDTFEDISEIFTDSKRYYNYHERTLNSKGDVVHNKIIRNYPYAEPESWVMSDTGYKYQYDDRGNWVSKAVCHNEGNKCFMLTQEIEYK